MQRWTWTALGLLLLAGLGWWATQGTHLHPADILQAQRELALRFAQHPVLAMTLYFVLFVTITALCLPGASIMMLVGAGCMGFGVCTLVSTAASAVGALLTMLATRHMFRSRVQQRFGQTLHKMDLGLQKNEVAYMLSLRLAPIIPFVVFNMLAGLTRTKAWTFLWTSFLGMLPGTLLYVNAGREISQIRQLQDLFSAEVMLSLTALAFVPLAIQHLVRQFDTSGQKP
ncbi:MAG TPA: VTT domain-containing protein [Limnobacter sp.]|nr:VTT domain-containing protein [Limnobacter sp.]